MVSVVFADFVAFVTSVHLAAFVGMVKSVQNVQNVPTLQPEQFSPFLYFVDFVLFLYIVYSAPILSVAHFVPMVHNGIYLDIVAEYLILCQTYIERHIENNLYIVKYAQTLQCVAIVQNVDSHRWLAV